MKSAIKIIKRKQDEKYEQNNDPNELKSGTGEKSVTPSTAELTSIINGWIAELHERKRTQSRSF